jgi:hypothetical protein
MADSLEEDISLEILPMVTGYGDNTIVWEPEGIVPDSLDNATYSVTVSNVVVPEGNSRTFSYYVTIIQPPVE